MNKKISNEEQQRLMSNMEDQIHQLRNISQNIRRTLDNEKQTRDSLGDYLDKGTEALGKINGVLTELGSKYTMFGCNGLIVVGIAILTILILALF